jgi:large subunit ribosomal protein L19
MAGLQLSARSSMGGGAPAKLAATRRATVSSAAGVSCSLHTLMQTVDKQSMKSDLMDFRVGREITVGVQVIEGAKTRVQPYKGLIIAIHKNGLSSSVTVRKMVQGVGVERVFPLHSPLCTFEAVVSAGTPKVSNWPTRLYPASEQVEPAAGRWVWVPRPRLCAA